ncbi:MAG: hypothetical protein IKO39_01290 [Treponema sp.]|nr:hypothetical protein [Treponema sp.]
MEKFLDDSFFYSGPLKKAYTAFKPCRYFRKLGDSVAESFKMRVGFKDIHIIKLDMMKLNEIINKETNRFLGQNRMLLSFGLPGSMISTFDYKLLLASMFSWDIHGRPMPVSRGIGKVYEVFIDSRFWENLNDRNKSFFLLHEIGHIVLGHLDDPYCPINGNNMIVSEFERQANVYAQGICGKKADLKNAKYAIIEGNEILKYICEKEVTKIEDLTLNLLNNY